MGKKNKKEKKGTGKEKTEQKAEKKAKKRSKKELEGKGEEDIEKLIAEFQEEDKKKVQVTEEKCKAPPPRCNASLVSVAEREELLMFGGEYYTGNKMFVYNDLFVYQIRKQEWLKMSIPNAPPPRSAHQAVAVSQQDGQMWVFGGEFSSHSQAQFYHYKDLWLLHLKDKKWEQIKAPGGPSARSGHRMIALKKQLIVFGGFHDNTRDYKYFNDVYSFSLETYTWSLLNPSGNGPSPRSGCVLFPISDTGRAVVYGGYSKEKMKKDVDKGTTHSDMFILAPEKKREGVSDQDQEQRWKWQSTKQSALHPSPRSGMTGVLGPNNRAFCFGGVFDEEDEDDEFLEGAFYNELWMLDLEKLKWFPVQLRDAKDNASDKKKRRRKKIDASGGDNDGIDEDGENTEESDDDETMMEVTQEGVEKLDIQGQSSHVEAEDSVFKVSVAAPSTVKPNTTSDMSDGSMEVDSFWPSRRMNPALAVKSGQLYLYGGMFEDGDKQLTLSDMYSLDVQRPNAWKVHIAADPSVSEWNDSDSEDDKGEQAAGGGDDEDSDDDSDDSMDICFDDAPSRREGEGKSDYFDRSKDYWVSKAREIYEEDGETISERRLLKFAKEVCDEAC